MLNREEMEVTARKIALLLAESKATFSQVDAILEKSKRYLSVAFNSSDSGE